MPTELRRRETRCGASALHLIIYVLLLLVIGGALIRFACASDARNDAAVAEIRAACEADARAQCPMSALIAAWLGRPAGVHRCFVVHHDQFSRHCRDVLARHGHR